MRRNKKQTKQMNNEKNEKIIIKKKQIQGEKVGRRRR